MILRKPFAILIKNFKLIHIILTVLSFYLIYRTNLLLSFFNEYMGTYNSVIGNDLTGTLYSPLMYISLIVIIIGSLIILGLMLFKKKQVKLYIYNIVTYIVVAIIYAISRSIVSSLEIELVDIRTLKMIQDLLTTTYGLQLVSIILVAIRATGFNIKKFDFTKDLQELEIEDIDNEEFEVNVDLNSDETRRKINRTIRHIKYIYKENKFVIISFLVLLIGISSFAIYMNVGVYNKLYNKNEAFDTNYFTLQLGNSYSTNTDYQGKKLLKDETFVIIHMNIKNKMTKDRSFDSGRLTLKIDEHYFYHDKSYTEQLFDLGNIYNEELLNNEFNDHVFVYKIPKDFLNSKLKLIYTDYNKKEIQMKIEPISLMGESKVNEYRLSEIISLKESILGDIKVQIDGFDIADSFRIDYDYCINNECFPSYEYLKPTLTGNNKKTLLKITGNISGSDNSKITNLYSLISNFGYIEYEIQNVTKTVSLKQTRIKPTKTTLKDEYYIEMLDEIKYADKIKIVLKVRNKIYQYNIK